MTSLELKSIIIGTPKISLIDFTYKILYYFMEIRMKITLLNDKPTLTSEFTSSWVGLFWLNKDLSDFVIHHADKEVSPADLTKGEDIIPDVSHRGSWPTIKNQIQNANLLKFNSLPRGRVEYSGKEKSFVVKTGNWLTDDLKLKIIDYYKLRNKKVRFDQNPFWDSR
jgi:hypothetical protein